MQDQSLKADAGKSDPRLLLQGMPHALEAVNRVLDYGVDKYGVIHGWQAVTPDRYDAAAKRHARERDKGERFDVESGLPHIAHEITNLLFQLELEIRNTPQVDYLTYNDPPQDHLK